MKRSTAIIALISAGAIAGLSAPAYGEGDHTHGLDIDLDIGSHDVADVDIDLRHRSGDSVDVDLFGNADEGPSNGPGSNVDVDIAGQDIGEIDIVRSAESGGALDVALFTDPDDGADTGGGNTGGGDTGGGDIGGGDTGGGNTGGGDTGGGSTGAGDTDGGNTGGNLQAGSPTGTLSTASASSAVLPGLPPLTTLTAEQMVGIPVYSNDSFLLGWVGQLAGANDTLVMLNVNLNQGLGFRHGNAQINIAPGFISRQGIMLPMTMDAFASQVNGA